MKARMNPSLFSPTERKTQIVSVAALLLALSFYRFNFTVFYLFAQDLHLRRATRRPREAQESTHRHRYQFAGDDWGSVFC